MKGTTSIADNVHASSVAERGRISWRWGIGLLVVPALALLAIAYVYPMVRMVLVSFEGSQFSTEHYLAFIQDPVYTTILGRTFAMAATTTVICLLLGYPAAYLLSHVPKRYRGWLLLLVVVPYLTSFLVRTYAWVVLLNDNGPINGALVGLGIVDEPVKLVYNTIGVHIGMVHVLLPLMILPLYAVMTAIDDRLVRAAYSMGAGPVRGFLAVYLPLSLPGVTSGCLLVFLISLGFYITPIMLGGLGDVMLVNLIDIQITRLGNWNFGAAASVVLLVVTLAAVVVIRQLSGSADVFGLGDGTMRRQSANGSSAIARVRKRLSGLLRHNAVSDAAMIIVARHRSKRWADLRARNRRSISIGKHLIAAYAAVVFIFLVIPTFIVIPLSFSSSSFLTFPPPGWSFRWYEHFFTEEGWVNGTLLSFQVGFFTTVLVTVLGTLAAYGLVRGRSRYRALIMALVISPLIVPPIVVGVGLYWTLVDIKLIGTVAGLVLGHSIGALAYVVVLVTAVLSRFDISLERAAMSLGAGPLRTFRKVTFPLIRPGIIAAAVFAFIHSFDELVITYLISPFGIKTLPRMMWQNIRNEIDPVIAATSSMLILVPLVVLLILKLTNRKSRGTDVRATPF